ncbi:hypothetical protein FPL20_GE04230 (plasmid) [Bacillus subtilis]|uniref:Uncharacterized protein n=1 Tax=Bacillus subtilis subsp. subtilis NCIB 3610 = ATCC 6051 = DSM 10 TaxID=535026 RepID=S5DW50_BACIU|nr:unknown [Bacillus subtilis subsp. subtilis NCIB 3610 = ATCC 6051 = DSM 10]OAZ70533.1 hypothetical protein SRCM101280_01173 [Bacillus subtilis]TDO84546.1 hypothetical protein BDW29_4335 [Bacillus sp. AtDRG31]TWG49491.1 hypothetical protein L608_000900000750 [Bacillus subtilis J23]BBK74916.1 hypothetical protein NBRC13719_42610 [Bacillus subtilis subsp. subtilis]
MFIIYLLFFYLAIPSILIKFSISRIFHYNIDFWGLYFIFIALYFLRIVFKK